MPFQLGGKTVGVDLRVERDDGGKADDAEPAWRIRFSLDAEPLGPVHAVVTLRNGTVGVALWAERDEGAEFLRNRAPGLTHALESTALDVTGLSIATGRPPHQPSRSGAVVDRRT